MRRFLIDNQWPQALVPWLESATMERAWPGINEQLDAGARLIEIH